MVIGSNKNFNLFNVILTISIGIFGIIMFYPFLNLIFISFSKYSDIVKNKGILFYPQGFNISAYQYVFRYNNFWPAYQNTVFITLIGTSLALFLTIIGGYVLSVRELPGRNFLTTIVVITMFFSGGLIPGYLNFRNLKLLDSLWVLIIPVSINTWYMLLARNFFQGIPTEILESAKIDGISEVSLILKIIIPLSLPIIATLSLFYGVGRWNEYTFAVLYNSKVELQTLQVVIRGMYQITPDDFQDMDNYVPPSETVRAATVIVATIPILCIYPFLQKYFAKGIMVGSVKG